MSRTGIGSEHSRSRGFRVRRGLLFVIRRRCPRCAHHKALEGITVVKCAKCKFQFQ